MSTSGNSADIHDLLAHADWLRGLAHSLCRDDDGADAVQETYLAALRSPPAADRPARPWLATVMRNFVRKRARGTRGRRARETEVATTSAAVADSPETLLESVQLSRLLGELVTALDEPYRSTIVLRHYRGLEPTEIARRQGVPAGTVRWRVNEGIRRLRTTLDARFGARAVWQRALLPLLPAPALPSTNLWTAKGVLMSTAKTKLTVAGLAAGLCVGALAWRQARSAADDRARASAAAAALAAVAAEARATSPSSSTAPAPASGEARAPTTPPKFVVPAPAAAPAAAGEDEAEEEEDAPSTGVARLVGGLDKDIIRTVMQETMPKIKECYEKLLANKGDAEGRLELAFTILPKDGTGFVSEATIIPNEAKEPADRDPEAKELVDPVTEHCIVRVISEAKFPAPKDGKVMVRYPLTFTVNRE